jgi:ABC-type amino acid transport substrate-binding protein
MIKKDGTYMKIMAKYYGGADAINKDALTDDMK